MLKRPTISERLNPPITAETIASTWNAALIQQLLAHLWAAYDALYSDVLRGFDWSQPTDDLERELTEKLFARLQRRFDASLPVYPMHAQAEREARSAPPAQPPLYDIAFVLYENDRLCWPVEAKVFHSDAAAVTNLGDYVQTLHTRILTCRYAPFSPSCAMVGYLKSGNSNTILNHLAAQIPCSMTTSNEFPTRAHRISDHLRSVPTGKLYVEEFRCHHLVMPLS